jgi:ferredoxin
MTDRLKVDMIACDGHGVCAELLPELIRLDEWGYPVLTGTPIPDHLHKHAKKAINLCPKLALSTEQERRPTR